MPDRNNNPAEQNHRRRLRVSNYTNRAGECRPVIPHFAAFTHSAPPARSIPETATEIICLSPEAVTVLCACGCSLAVLRRRVRGRAGEARMSCYRLRALWLVPLMLPLVAGISSAGVLFGKKSKRPPTPAERVPELLLLVKTDGDESKRAAAAQELRQYDAAQFPAIVPVLVDVLSTDQKPGVRAEAAQTLGKMRPISQQAGMALEQALTNDSSMRVRLQVQFAVAVPLERLPQYEERRPGASNQGTPPRRRQNAGSPQADVLAAVHWPRRAAASPRREAHRPIVRSRPPNSRPCRRVRPRTSRHSLRRPSPSRLPPPAETRADRN